MKYFRLLFLSAIAITIQSNLLAQDFLFYCSNESGTFQAYSKNLSTNQINTITSDNNFNYWWVEPSPSGTELILMRSPVGPGIEDQFDYDSCQMVKAEIDGTNLQLILDYNAYGWTAFGNPHWHPTDDKLIMLAQPTNEFFVYTVKSDGTNPIQLTSQFSIDPNWSHSGDKITFIGINADPTPFPSFDDFEVFTANYDASSGTISAIQQLTDDTRRDQDPCFSPDDTQIAFSSADNISLSIAHVTVIDTLGGNRQDFVNDNTTNGGPLNWGMNNKIYYHQVNFNIPPFTPFTAKAYDVNSNTNTDLFPSISEGYISPYYFSNPTVDISELENSQNLLVYPNPTNGTLSIQRKGNANLVIKIYSLSGHLMEASLLGLRNEINIAHYKQGVYVYQLIGDNSTSTGIIQKLD